MSPIADQTLEATGANGAAATFSTAAADLVDGTDLVVFKEGTDTVNSGDTFGLGSHTITASTTDAAGNNASEIFTIQVVDTTPPTLTAISDQTLDATGPDGAAATFVVTATDLVDGTDLVVFKEGTDVVNSGDTFGLGSHTITASATDAAGNTASESFAINVEDNDAQILSGTSTASYTEEGAAVALSTGILVSDPDNLNLASATVAITTGLFTGDVLNFTDQNNITGSYDSGTGVLSLAGSDTLAHYQAALRSITFSAGENPTNYGADASRTITWTVDDGQGGNTATATSTVSITNVNDLPEVTTSSGTTAATEQVAIAVDSGLTLTDLDNTTLASATVSISGNFHAGQDLLAFSNDNATMGNIASVYNASTGVLTLTSQGASASLLQWQAALRAVIYTDSSDAPDTSDRTISIVVDDGTDSSLAAVKTVSVAAVNDSPAAAIAAATLVAVAHQSLDLKSVGMTVSDVDALGGIETATLSVTEGTLAVTAGTSGAAVSNGATSAVTITGTLVQINALLGTDAGSAVGYIDDNANPAATATLTLSISDNGLTGSGGGPLTGTSTAKIDITAAEQSTVDNSDGTHTTHVWDVHNQYSWSDYILVTDSHMSPVTQTTNYDDGRRTVENWDVQGNNSWSNYVWSYDAQGHTASQTVNYRDGTYTAQHWDVSGQNTWSDWVGYYDSQNRETVHFVDNRDGTHTAQYFDVLGQNTWSDWVGYYDSNNQEIVHFVDNHDGSRTAQYFDVQHQYSWSSWVGYYDSHNRETAHFVNNDDGGRTAQYFDVQGQHNWTDFVFAFDSLNRLSSQTIDYRDGHHTVRMYDVDDTHNWSSVLTSYDAGWQQQSQMFFYDSPPVVLDLDGNGIDITPLPVSTASFDMSGSGERLPTAWIAGGDGLLAIDLGASGHGGPDGVIDQAKEINFTLWAPGTTSDLQALRQVFDTDHDGKLDPGDTRWTEFRVWTDANANGVSEPGEVRTLADLDITSIDLNPSPNAAAYPDGSSIQGLSSFTRADASTGLVGDVVFAYAAVLDSTLGYANNNSAMTTAPGNCANEGNVALLASYMASAFTTASDGHGATLLADTSQASSHDAVLAPTHA